MTPDMWRLRLAGFCLSGAAVPLATGNNVGAAVAGDRS